MEEKEEGVKEKSGKRKKKSALRAARRQAIAKSQAKKYKSASMGTAAYNKSEREKAAAMTKSNMEKYNKAYDGGMKSPEEAKNMARRTAIYTEKMDTGATPSVGTSKMMRQSMRNVRRKKGQMSDAAYRSNKKLYK